MKRMIQWGILLSSAYLVFPTQAASFDCAKAKTITEHAICEHRVINDADVKMATTYNIIRHLVPFKISKSNGYNCAINVETT